MILGKPTIGADPEFFILLFDEPISADRFFKPKSKDKVFFDGFQAEMNPKPADCRDIFITNVLHNLIYAYSKLPGDAKILPIATIHLTEKHLQNVDEECLRFGCSPDYSIYTEERPEYPDGRKHLKRYAGGHIHVGVKRWNIFNDTSMIIRAIKLMDRLAGLTSVVLSPYDDEKERREYYGQAGTYRLNSHGIEYRTPSSFWLSSPVLASLMTGLTRNAVRYAPDKVADEILSNPDDEEIIRIINKCDRKSAFDYLSLYHKIISKRLSNVAQELTEFPIAKKSIWNTIEVFYEKGGYRYFFNPSHILRYYSNSDALPNGIDTFANYLKHFSPKELREILDGGEETWNYRVSN